MSDKTKVVISTKVPRWFRRELGVNAAKQDMNISEYLNTLIRLGLRREAWLAREVSRRTAPQLEFPPILQETPES